MRTTWKTLRNETKSLTFLLALPFLFFLSCLSVANADGLQDARDALKRKDYKTAYKLWLPLAEQGDARAQFSLGMFYANGPRSFLTQTVHFLMMGYRDIWIRF